MSRLKWVVFALSVIVVFLVGLIALIYPKIEAQYQADADVQRVEGLFEIADLLEAYYDLMGYYPFSDEVPQDRYGVVLIGSSEQIDGLAIPKEFIVFPVSDLEDLLSEALDESIVLPHDPQLYSVNGRPTIYDYKVYNGVYYIKTYLNAPIEGFTDEVSGYFYTLEIVGAEGCAPCGTVWSYDEIRGAL